MTGASFTSGGCQCGAVRYRLHEPLSNPHICHCRMCQKAKPPQRPGRRHSRTRSRPFGTGRKGRR